jgi:hypothetical protein
MESWRKPVVLENTSALNAGSAACAAVAAVAADTVLVATAAAIAATTNGLVWRASPRNRDIAAVALLVRDIY